jgi:fumarylacetoacetate (FAA) hydrolase family protein
MLEKLLTVTATLPRLLSPKDAHVASLVGRVNRPGLGPSVVRVNPDATLTDITDAFPTVSLLCNESDPAASLRAATGEPIGSLAEILKSRRLLAPIDLQTVKAAGVTFPVSMIERMIEEALRGDMSNSSKRSEVIGRIKDSVGSISALTPATPEALKLLQYLTDVNGLNLSATYPQVGLGEKAEIFTKQAVPLASVGHGAEAGFNADSKWTNPEPELVSVISAHGKIVGATLGNDVNDRYLEGLSALLLGVAKDRRGSSAVGPFIRLFDDRFTLDTIRNIRVNLHVDGTDGFHEEGVNSMSEIRRDPQDVLAKQLFDIHDYPDGVVLFNGTGIVPTSDRGGVGSGFFHKTGDMVHIFADELGSLANVMVPTGEVQMHEHSMFQFMKALARRGVL